MKLYQILNFQFDSVKFFSDLDEAKRYVDVLQETYGEDFYIVELPIVHFAPKRVSDK